MAACTLKGVHLSITRGHETKLKKFRVKYDLRKFYFSSRIVNIWNSLSSHVIYAESVNSFKTRNTFCGTWVSVPLLQK